MSAQEQRLMRLSWMLFGAGFIALGVLVLIYGDFSLVLQAMPRSVPGRGAWIYACGAVMLAGGAGLLFARSVGFASRILLVYLLLWLLLLKVPILAKAPWVIGSWEIFAETAALLSGAWVIVASLPDQRYRLSLKFVVGTGGLRLARILFGIALFLFGLAHFGYLKYTAALVPAWLPWHLGWACLTGAAYMAASMGTLFRIYPRLAAALTAVMMGLFQLLVWVPRAIAVPEQQANWSELLVGCALAFSVWVVADSYRGVAWLSVGTFSKAAANSEKQTAV